MFLPIFKGLAQDPYDVVHKVLEACWSGIWSDPKVTRTLKIGLFQEATIAHVIFLIPFVSPLSNFGF
jgi:nucleolar pre-ribosomal-associated protein 1